MKPGRRTVQWSIKVHRLFGSRVAETANAQTSDVHLISNRAEPMPELAEQRADGVIDRFQMRDIPTSWPAFMTLFVTKIRR